MFKPQRGKELKWAEVVLSVESGATKDIPVGDMQALEEMIWRQIRSQGGDYGFGGYGEKRHWYQQQQNFREEDEGRTIHLGVDLWAPAGTEVLAPLDGVVHSFKDNQLPWDYGPTIILDHGSFFGLYGHLSVESLGNHRVGEVIKKGQEFCRLGGININGGWPPHLHFQLITDIGDWKGDFPGVAPESEKERWLELCPDPAIYVLTTKDTKGEL